MKQTDKGEEVRKTEKMKRNTKIKVKLKKRGLTMSMI